MQKNIKGPASQRTRVAVLGMYGQLNMGNECTLQALLVNMRRICPDAEAVCICPEPRDVAIRHRLKALRLSVAGNPTENGGALGRLLSSLKPIQTRLRALRWAYSNLADTRMLVVAGTGIFEENIGLSRGWLCDILTWCVAARLRGCFLAFVSIGAGPLHRFFARVVVKSALRLANYVSYRDQFSANYMASIGLSTKSHSVFPDLAFSLPPALLNLSPFAGESHQRTIGVGIMDYFGQRRANRRTTEQYRAYLGELAAFVLRLIDNGYRVKILGGDAQYDPQVLIDLKEQLAVRHGLPVGGELLEAHFDTVEGLIKELRAVDAVVATRFHNLVLALMLKRPTVSVSYHEKNEALMESFGLAEFSQDVDKLNGAELDKQLVRVIEAWQHYQPSVEKRLQECRRQLEDQYSTLFQRLGGDCIPAGKV